MQVELDGRTRNVSIYDIITHMRLENSPANIHNVGVSGSPVDATVDLAAQLVKVDAKPKIDIGTGKPMVPGQPPSFEQILLDSYVPPAEQE